MSHFISKNQGKETHLDNVERLTTSQSLCTKVKIRVAQRKNAPENKMKGRDVRYRAAVFGAIFASLAISVPHVASAQQAGAFEQIPPIKAPLTSQHSSMARQPSCASIATTARFLWVDGLRRAPRRSRKQRQATFISKPFTRHPHPVSGSAPPWHRTVCLTCLTH